MSVLATNTATSTLASGIASGATSLTVTSGHGTRFPAPSGGDYFYLTLIGVGKYEVVKVTARSTDTMTIVRAQDGTLATAFDAGDNVKLLINAAYVTDLWTAMNLRANIASPTFTGTPLAPTAAVDTNTTQIATTAYVMGQGYLKSSTASSTYQPLDADLTSIASLGYSSTSFLKKTAANTWTLDTTTYQPLDADLTAIAALSFTSTAFLKKTAADTWALDTATYEPSISAGTTGQYWRGDKSWQTLNATAVGLGNVTNESKATMFSSPTFTGTASVGTILGTGASQGRLTLNSSAGSSIEIRSTEDAANPGRVTITGSGGALVLPGSSGSFTYAGNDIHHAGNSCSSDVTYTDSTPTVTAGSGSFTTVSAALRRQQIGAFMHWNLVITITDNGSAAGYISVAMPFTAAKESVGAGRQTGSGGLMCQGVMAESSSTMIVMRYDNVFPGATGQRIALSGVTPV